MSNNKIFRDDERLDATNIYQCFYRKSVLQDDNYDGLRFCNQLVDKEYELEQKVQCRKKSSIITHLEKKRKLTLF